jgi:hypothetical protein
MSERRAETILREGWTFRRLGDGSVRVSKRLVVGQNADGGKAGFEIDILLLPHEWVSVVTACARDVNEQTLITVRQLHLEEG